MSAATDFRPLELRLGPEYRRCAAYAVVGFGLVAAALCWMTWTGFNDAPWADVLVTLAVVGTPTVFLLALTVRYRLRIDERGVWRRRLVCWDLWPWEAFEHGRIRHGRLGDQLTYPDKPWHSRTISASLLGERDRAAFEAVVRRYRVPPPPPELPAVVEVRYGLATRLELSADGVRLRANRDDDGRRVPWPDVVRAELVRATHDRPDFATLELHLPDMVRPVRLTQYQGRPQWKGPDAEVIAHFLGTHLADGRFQVTALRGPPADVAEADRRLARLADSERRLRNLNRITRYVFVPLLVALFVGLTEPWNLPNWGPAEWAAAAAAVVVVGLQAAMILGVHYFQARELRRQRDELLRWRAAKVGRRPRPDD